MQDHFYSASDLKARAREAIRIDPPTLLMLTFLASLPGLINTTVTTVLQGSGLMSQVYSVLLNAGTDETTEQLWTRVISTASSYFQSSGGRIASAVQVVVWLITPMLSLGLLAGLLKLLRNEPVSASDVLSRGGCFFKAIGLQLLIIVKLLLWMVPGLALSLVSIPVLLWTNSWSLYLLIFMAGVVMMMVLGIRAGLHYVLAEPLLADRPDTGILTAVRESVGCMRTRKMAYATLYISFIGWILLTNLA